MTLCKDCGVEFDRPTEQRARRYCLTCRPADFYIRGKAPNPTACKGCGAQTPHYAGSRPRLYCSARCRWRAQGEKKYALGKTKPYVPVPVRTFTCKRCGAAFETDHTRRYCSTRCRASVVDKAEARKAETRSRNQPRPCSFCGTVFDPRTVEAMYCSKDCKSRAHKLASGQTAAVIVALADRITRRYEKAARQRLASTLQVLADTRRKAEQADAHAQALFIALAARCAGCATPLEPRFNDRRRQWRTNRIWCSDRCCKTTQRNADKALKRNLPSIPFRPEAVLARDQWQCRMCGTATPKHLRGCNVASSPELDHVLPMAKGGPHQPDNARCLCRRCNGTKGAMLTLGFKGEPIGPHWDARARWRA